ncbi:hypothetical protein BDF19DRAFT_439706 [Syncephalis fuscata]|nr:hypothetical protein BDF19DRAFT_439706 [Syncephalis fuscata]
MPRFSQLSPQAQRLVVMTVSMPIFVATSWMLYRRVILGEEQRTPPSQPKKSSN